MLNAQNLNFGARLNLKQFSAELAKITVVLGSNGAGKSTLLNGLAGLLESPKLALKLNELDLLNLEVEARAKRLALLTQRQTLDFDFTVKEVVRMGLYPLNLSNSLADQRFDQIVDALDLHALLQRRYPTLSRGEAQRTQIARILMQRSAEPGVVLMDEPLTALDLRHQQDVMQLLTRLKRDEGHCFVLVLHDLNIAAQFGDQFALLERGKLLGFGGDEILQPDLLSQVFEIEIQRKEALDGRPQFAAVMTND